MYACISAHLNVLHDKLLQLPLHNTHVSGHHGIKRFPSVLFYSMNFVFCVYMVEEILHELVFTHNLFNLSNKTFRENYYYDPL